MNSNDRASLIKRINTLEGLTDKERSALLGLLRENKTYGLVWEDKPEDVEERLRNELPILTEAPERAIISEDKDAPNHILIEGDNLEALATLAYTHEGKIDVIYIDPPYNTGNKDFIYNDSYVDKEDSYRHSKWLSFMSRRLKIAKKLLSDRGVIFISIDDNEQAQLKLLCDEIFSPSNFVGTYFWKRTSTPPALSYKIRRKLEYVLCYQKTDIPQRTYAQGYVDGGDAPLLNSGNPMGILQFPIGSVHFNLPDGVYSAKSTYKMELLENVIVEHGININTFSARGHFKWGQNNLEKEVSEGTYFLIKSLQFSPRFQKSTKATKVPSNIVDDEVGVGTNEDAQKEVEALNVDFNYAKPISLISYLSKMPFWNEKDITILDFFAGSGTTLHATMQLNAEDGGHRQCILVTNNENNICEEVTYERNRRVIQGYTNAKGEEVAGLTKNNLRYYRTGFVGRNRSIQNMRKLVNLATDMLCVKENLYTEQNTFGGQKTYKGVFRYFDDGKKQMLVIYREEAINELVDIIYDMDISQPIKVYVFSPSEDPWEGSFDDVSDKVELCALPQAIYNTYRRILPKKKDAVVMPEEDALASTQEDKDLFEGMLNFTDEEEA
ncbi:site-specific DNA-methyltransferase [Phocaeicola barnesiae]|uniref:site-specific DNA-methyltransferase n=1 Tax=Phocaeicola barnesiae TaxID=376804 RepID=UPI0025A3BC50|nr:site-specific DNA-methyltransferase [Phocaeicola barnesiae]MDM8250334.1 site-specific DNA-methyltransferase [Phocaeicola barnesiae]